MKKSLLALALFGAFAGAASAQSTSSVTLYGILDTGIQINDPKNGDNTTSVYSGGQSGSRWGLRGSEDLGGGLRGIFNLEGGFNVDNGTQAQGGRLFGRWAYVGLAGNFGEVRLGRQWAAGYEFFGDVDPWGTAFFDAGIQTTFTSADALRLDNMVSYRTPKLGGFSGMVGWSLNPGLGANASSAGTEQPKIENNVHVVTGALRYAIGPALVVATGELFNCPDNTGTASSLFTSPNCNATTKKNQEHYQLGGTFDLKFLKLHAAGALERNQFILPNGTAGAAANATTFAGQQPFASQHAVSWLAGVTVPVAGGNIIASYQKRNDRRATDFDTSDAALGFTYPLSRRTNVYTYFSDRFADGNTPQVFERRQYTLGVRHLF